MKSWRHLDFFQHSAYLTARVPRCTCPEHGVKQVSVPWARPGSGFTLLFEALMMMLFKDMPVASAARLMGEYDGKLWRVLHHHVDEAVESRAGHAKSGTGSWLRIVEENGACTGPGTNGLTKP